MTEEQAIDLAAHLSGLMPKITDDQAKVVRNELRPLDRDRCAKAIDDFAGTHADFNLAEFLNWLPGRQTGTGPVHRTAEYLRQHAAELEELETFWNAVNALIESLPAEELESHRVAVLEQLDEHTRALASRRELKRNRLLKGMIYQRVLKLRSEAAQ